MTTMATLRSGLLQAFLALCVSALVASVRAKVTTYRLQGPVSAAPVIDGVLEDRAWSDALRITSFHLLGGPANDDLDLPATTAFLAYDSDALYVAFRCAEPLMSDLVTTASEHDGNTWMDDGVEVFLNPSGDRTHYVQLAVNTAGVVMDGFKAGPRAPLELSWETDTRVGVSQDDAGWQMELRIPLYGLPVAAPDATWTFHLARNRRTAGQHITSLQSPVSGFHEVQAFDRLEGIELPGRQVAVKRMHPGSIYRGINLATVRVHNHGNTSRPVRAVLTISGNGAEKIRVEREGSVPPGEDAELVLPWTLDATTAASSFQVVMEVRSGDHLLRRSVTSVDDVPSVIGPLSRKAHVMHPHEPVVLRLPIQIGDGSRSGLTLRWQAFDAAGGMVGEGMTTVRTDHALIRLFWDAWYDGRYRLQLVLNHNDSPLATAGRRIRLVRSPWGG